MFGIGYQELIVIFLVFILLFGAKSIPEIAKSLGKAMKIFKKEIDGIGEESVAQRKTPDQAVSQSPEDENNKTS